MNKIISILLSLFLITGSGVIAFAYESYNTYPYTNNYYSSPRQPSEIYRGNVSSMVYIKTQDRQGSGVIVRPDGTIVTCFHVIANADYIQVKLNDGSIYNVNGFKYINPVDDIAILTIDSQRTFKPIRINYSNTIKIGETVFTISNPQGLQFVFSDGMINQHFKECIQFSAPVSPGSSGGALLNDRGELLGIITSLFKESQNINFALPNRFYLSKINNPVILNSQNLKWTDFVIKNATESQFKLYAEYALISKDFSMFYKYLKPFVGKKDYPAQGYALAGFYAFFAFMNNDDAAALQDAIAWYEKSVIYNVNLEPSLLALMVLYLYKEEKERAYDIYTQLQQYPYTFKILTNAADKIVECEETDISCQIDSMESLFLRLTELTQSIAKNYYKNKSY